MMIDCPPLPVPMPVFIQQVQAKLPHAPIVSGKLSDISCLVELTLENNVQIWVDTQAKFLLMGAAYSLETGSILSNLPERKNHDKK